MVRTYLSALFIFFTLDMLWLGVIAKSLYADQLGFLLSEKVYWPAAIAFYLIFIGGLVGFVIHPALQNKNWRNALLKGACFGFVTYATYDLTNMATIEKWPLFVTLVDLAWGAILAAAVSVGSYFVNVKRN